MPTFVFHLRVARGGGLISRKSAPEKRRRNIEYALVLAFPDAQMDVRV
jgi:hypothetical protein